MNKPLTRNMKADRTPVSLAEYQASGGYQGLARALKELAPTDVITRVKNSGLRGRGGAGFSTGIKWSLVPQGPETGTKYVVVNGDEMEPGTFKDRYLLEGDPHQLIEGVAITAYAVGAAIGYIFLRGEYTLAARRLEVALNECYAANLLGEHILGSDFSLEVHIHTSAGRYICGEETALLNSLEGKRANPRSKPPFPQISGLFGRPTVVNNIETLCNIPHIIREGEDWYKSLGRGQDAGTKIFGVSGRVKNPGLWELPMGTTIRELLEEHAGGMKNGLKIKGFLPGGASTDFLTEQHLDLTMDYDVIGKAGSRLGTGTMIILDNETCPVAMVLNLQKFFAQESCGWCTPCRDGLPWVVDLLENLLAGRGRAEDIAQLEKLGRLMGPGNTFCALAPGAAEPLLSALRLFRSDFLKYLPNSEVIL